jgi:hypothetical protein
MLIPSRSSMVQRILPVFIVETPMALEKSSHNRFINGDKRKIKRKHRRNHFLPGFFLRLQ